jgi:hypothetical protein
MSTLGTRLARLEAVTVSDRQPVILWGDEPEPQGNGDRPIVRVRWLTEAEAAAA